jgi:endonuclease/exonuclease/phosphatase family metal-dependent hydrolase
MKKVQYLFYTFFALLLSISPLQAQLFEDFESTSKLGYAGGTATFETGTWFLEDALNRSDGSGDLKNGSYSVRIREGFLRMDFDKTNGVNELSFLAGNSSFSGDGNGKIQVYYSTDGGNNWIVAGNEISVTDNLESYTIALQLQDDVRFRFNKTSGGRVNIDDVKITDYITPEDKATIDVFVDGQKVEAADSVYFAGTIEGSERTKTVQIKNRGNEQLDISSVVSPANEYSISALTDSSLAFGESGTFTITFAPQSDGIFDGEISITSNAVNHSEFNFNVFGEAFADNQTMPIADARQLPFGTRVTVGGRITVANEFEGPSFMQDGTAGLAVFWDALHTSAKLGDSVVVTGPLTEFNPIGGADGDFLLQIGATNTDKDVSFEIIDTAPKPVIPTVITVSQMNSGDYEAQLVLIKNAVIDHSGVFDTNDKNYGLSDGTGQAFIRIDGSTNIGGAEAPSGPVNVIGVVDQFNGDYQLKPRSTQDLGLEELSYPGEDVPFDSTLEVVTWNLEWFGSASNGPDDLDQQFENVKRVIRTIDADLYAFQEVSNTARFNQLLDSLDNYGGVLANFSQTQKTAFLFKKSVIDSVSSGLVSVNMTKSFWANGRYPLYFRFHANIGDESREIYAYNIHAKAFGDVESYNKRVGASGELKTYFDNSRSGDNVIFVGDYNDTTIGSIATGKDSPYKNFVDDTEYTIITRSLESKGLGSQSQGSFIDHITINSGLKDEYFEGTVRVANTSYIGSYKSTTSDHYPVWTRFAFKNPDSLTVGTELLETPVSFTLNQNYPNPFNPSTVISYKLTQSSKVILEVFDVMGRKVATLVNGNEPAGLQTVTFDASSLASGVYIYRLSTAKGEQLTRKMMLIK